MIIERVTTKSQMKQAIDVRLDVFVHEQGVPLALEIDGKDEQSVHWIATSNDRVCGTVRLRPMHEKQVKLERLAVRSEARRQGIARALIVEAERYAQQVGATEIVLHAQVQALPLYEQLGYEIASPLFLEAGIEHRTMKKII